MKEIRTYMQFTHPVDPVKIQTIPDMDLSYALASTLVEWDPEKQVTGALAESWKISGEREFQLTLRKGVQWSNGSALTSESVKRSLLHGIKAHPEDLRSLVNLMESVECLNDRVLAFKLKVPAASSGFLKKLTEPNFGIHHIDGSGVLELAVSSGPFFLKRQSSSELILEANPHWHRHSDGMPKHVTIRRTPEGHDTQTALLRDSWPNLAETSSLISAETLSLYKKGGYTIWERPTDKVFLLQLSRRRADQDHFLLLRYLQKKLDRSQLTDGMTGFTLAQQVFPMGYTLFDSNGLPKAEPITALPAAFKGKPLEIKVSQARTTPTLLANIKKVLTEATGTAPHVTLVPLQDSRKVRIAGDYDFYAGPMGLADPDPEGVMSFYFEGEAPVVPSSKENNFLERLDRARKASAHEERVRLMRSIVTDAVAQGHVLPLFHFSTVGLGRPPLNFDGVPSSDESVTLSKIRFRSEGGN